MILPWWVKWLALLALVAGAFGYGLVQGIDYESMRRDAKDAEAMRAFDAARKVYIKRVVKIKTVYVERRESDIRLRNDLMGEVAKHATEIPDPPQCWLDDRRVQSINRAIDAGSGGPGAAAGVSLADPAGFWEPSGGRDVGGGHGLRVPGVREAAPGAVGYGEGEAGDRGAARGG